jgi:hypothetical protein
MTFEERVRVIVHFDELIRRGYRGGAMDYARRLGLSRGSFFRLLTNLRCDFQAPVLYSKSRQCYEYQQNGSLHFGFQLGEGKSSVDPINLLKTLQQHHEKGATSSSG